MKPWPRRADVVAVKPYTLSYPDFCCTVGNDDFLDNKLTRACFGYVCKKQITDEEFQDRLAELWGANPDVPLHYAELADGKIAYVMKPGLYGVKIPANWPDHPPYLDPALKVGFDRCRRMDNDAIGLGTVIVDEKDEKKDEAPPVPPHKQEGLKWFLLGGAISFLGVLAVAASRK